MKDNILGIIIGIIALISMASGPYCQEPPEGFTDFSGGINTNDNPFQVQDNQFYQLKNFVLDDPKFGLSIRPGIEILVDSVGTIADRFSLHSHRFTDGTGYLLEVRQPYVTDHDSPFGELRVSGKFGYDATTLLDTVFPGEGNWLTWLGHDFYFDGKSAGYVATKTGDNYVGAPFVPQAPGQLTAIPMDTAGPQNGRYIYAYQIEIPCTTAGLWSQRCTPLSRVVDLRNQPAWLTGFYPTAADTLCVKDATYEVRILRSRANALDYENDSLFIVDSFFLDEADFATGVSYVDLIDDATVTGKFWKTIKEAQNAAALSRHLLRTGIVPGTIGFLKQDSITTDSIYSSNDGLPVIGEMLYTYYLFDSLTGAVGDTAAIMPVQTAGGPPFYIHNVVMEIPAPLNGRYWRIIIRAKADIQWPSPDAPPLLWNIVDTLIDPDSTHYFDNVHDSILDFRGNLFWEREVIEANPQGAIVHESHMFLWDDTRLYQSNSDTAGQVGIFDNLEFDLDDGDRTIGAASFDGYLILWKTKSTWIVYTSDGIIYDREKKSAGWGMASFNSLGSYAGNNIFASPEGILFEAKNPTLDRALQRSWLTDPIKNIFVRTIAEMAMSSAEVFGDRYYFSFEQVQDADEDTTFVYFFKTGGWVAWTFAMRSPVLYDTLNAVNYGPFNELVFLGELGDQRIYRLTEDDTLDAGQVFEAVLEKRHIGLTNVSAKSLQSISLYKNANTDDTSTLRIDIFDDQGRLLGDSLGAVIFDTLSYFYDKQFVAFESNRVVSSFTIKLKASSHTNLELYALIADWIEAGEQFRR